MARTQNLVKLIPRRYRHYPYLVIFICILIFLLYFRHSEQPQVQITIDDDSDSFDLFDDDDMLLDCPLENGHSEKMSIVINESDTAHIWQNKIS